MRYQVVLTVSLALAASHARASEPGQTIQFNRDIRPILSDNCFLCHGPAKATRKADLRLDTKENAFEDRGGYKIVVPGDLKESHLWLRVAHEDESERMPPLKSGRKLTPKQIELLRLWIEQGAKW